ncbi:MalM family protein [Aliivibrio sp. S2TY2]|uniref:MalM family protein n=1 Tax=unclassified Aliivibrio TaxID=2645654 RepID=UPI0023781F1B|nr:MULTISPECIES: MalM family protein [unclassified Aliivibrio]MDD9175696.1 MalM family protein [Aliivibrio sp. S3TY1]MDD9192730.1 MalM family protein [Aliivibrio sp. S2TY2]
MNTKKLLLSLFIGLSLTACSSTQVIQEPMVPITSSEVCCSDFSQYPWIQLATTEDIDFQLDKDSPIGHFSDGNSYFNAFKLSDRSGKVQLRLSSLMINDSVVAPKLIALDHEFNVVNTTSLDQFNIKPSDAFTRTQFQLNFQLDATKTPYFIIYSSNEYLGQSIKVKHPARIRAEELGEPMPMVTDPTYAYERFGKLKLSIKTLSLQAHKQAPQQPKVAIKSAQPETHTFYKEAIAEAVKTNDIPKALALLEEAKALGIKDAETIFVNALENKK